MIQHPPRFASTRIDTAALGKNADSAKPMPTTCSCTAKNLVANARHFLNQLWRGNEKKNMLNNWQGGGTVHYLDGILNSFLVDFLKLLASLVHFTSTNCIASWNQQQIRLQVKLSCRIVEFNDTFESGTNYSTGSSTSNSLLFTARGL